MSACHSVSEVEQGGADCTPFGKKRLFVTQVV